jgi:hypothetical protein
MGSAAHLVREVVRERSAQGERVGALLVRLYRPFSAVHLVRALPPSVERIAVLDRTKEPGAVGEPLYLDVVAALNEAFPGRIPLVTGGRFGLASKEFTPEMVSSVLLDLGSEQPRRHFSIGIVDDVTHESLPLLEPAPRDEDGRYEALFFGLGSDGTVSANKNTIKIVAEESERAVQGYFVYDSKKAGTVTTSHLRFADRPIVAPYLIRQADFIGCHQFDFLERLDGAGRFLAQRSVRRLVECARQAGTRISRRRARGRRASGTRSPHQPGDAGCFLRDHADHRRRSRLRRPAPRGGAELRQEGERARAAEPRGARGCADSSDRGVGSE